MFTLVLKLHKSFKTQRAHELCPQIYLRLVFKLEYRSRNVYI